MFFTLLVNLKFLLINQYHVSSWRFFTSSIILIFHFGCSSTNQLAAIFPIRCSSPYQSISYCFLDVFYPINQFHIPFWMFFIELDIVFWMFRTSKREWWNIRKRISNLSQILFRVFLTLSSNAILHSGCSPRYQSIILPLRWLPYQSILYCLSDSLHLIK